VLQVRLFGALEVIGERGRLGGRELGGIKPRQLFEILVTERGRPVGKERLADLLWADARPRNTAATIETAVSHLRRHLQGATAATVVVTEAGAYRIDPALVDLDLDRFDRLRRGPGRAELEAALALVSGELLADEPHASWAIALRDLHRRRHLDALLAAADAAARDGDHPAALGHAEAAIARDRACERAYQLAIGTYRALGRREDAIVTLASCRAALAEELGVAPLPATVALAGLADPDRPDPAAEARRPAATVEVPLLGRSGELDRLAAAAGDGARGATLLLIEGEPGIGKSRLLAELRPALTGWSLLAARCFPLERELPFAPLAEALRGLGEAVLGDPRYPALGEVVPELGPSGLGPERGRARALESLVALVRARAPLGLLLDDLQWADPSTVTALGYLLRRCAGCALLVVATFRGDEVGADHPIRRLEPAVHLELPPLTPGELGPLGDPGLHGKTGGNPLFLLEYLRCAADGGEVPASLRELLLARAAAAGPRPHRILSVASVLGRSVDPTVLAALLDEPQPTVLEELEGLCAARLLSATADGRFEFRHDLMHEALVASLSPARRRELHGRALAALEAAGAEPASLAHIAMAAARPDAAFRHALRAGDLARARWGNREALAHYERARQAAAELAGALEPGALEALLLRLGRVLVTLGRAAEGEAALASARASAEARGDEPALYDAIEAQSVARHRGASDPSGALRHARDAFAVAQRIAEPAVLGRAHALLGGPLGSMGLLDEASRHCHAAIELAQAAGQAPAGFPLGRIALVLHFRGRDAEALGWCARAEAAGVEQRDEETVLMARWVAALALAALGRFHEAWVRLDSIAEIGAGEEAFWHARVPNTYGALLADLCLPERALERDLESLGVARTSDMSGVREAELHSLLNVAGDRIALGRLDAARADLEEVRRQVGQVEYARFRWLARLHATDTDLALADGDRERARSSAEACLLLADKYGQPKYEVRARLGLARALAGQPSPDGRRAAARQARRAAALAEAIGNPTLVWRASAVVHGIDGDPEALRRARQAVRQIADGLGETLRRQFLAVVPVEP
jgi:DNA-binding SARP family transcriptional activator/tetratricopeptide (TPR) repeat protein